MKNDQSDSLRKNLLFWFLCQKGPKWSQNGVFQVLSKIYSQNFSDFLYKTVAAHKLKIDLTELFEQESCFEVFVTKVVQNGHKMKLSRYYQKSMHGTFMIFYMKLQWHHKDIKLT